MKLSFITSILFITFILFLVLDTLSMQHLDWEQADSSLMTALKILSYKQMKLMAKCYSLKEALVISLN